MPQKKSVLNVLTSFLFSRFRCMPFGNSCTKFAIKRNEKMELKRNYLAGKNDGKIELVQNFALSYEIGDRCTIFYTNYCAFFDAINQKPYVCTILFTIPPNSYYFCIQQLLMTKLFTLNQQIYW